MNRRKKMRNSNVNIYLNRIVLNQLIELPCSISNRCQTMLLQSPGGSFNSSFTVIKFVSIHYRYITWCIKRKHCEYDILYHLVINYLLWLVIFFTVAHATVCDAKLCHPVMEHLRI